MKILLLILVILLASCATSKRMYLPDGSYGHNISCDGAANKIGNCFQKAGDLCGASGYTLLNREGEAIPFSHTQAGVHANEVNANGVYVQQSGSWVSRSIFIRCN